MYLFSELAQATVECRPLAKFYRKKKKGSWKGRKKGKKEKKRES